MPHRRPFYDHPITMPRTCSVQMPEVVVRTGSAMLRRISGSTAVHPTSCQPTLPKLIHELHLTHGGFAHIKKKSLRLK